MAATPEATTSRFVQDQGTGTIYDTAGGFLDPLQGAADFQARAGNNDYSGVAQAPNAQQYFQNRLTAQAQARLLPQQDLALQGIDQANLGLDQNTTDINRQYDTLGQSLEDAAKQSTGSLQESANNFGLLSSGLTAAGLGKIQSDLSKNKGNAAQDRASQLAQIALQRAGLATKAADIKLQTSQGINDLVNQLLSQSTQAQQNDFNRQLQLKQIADTLPVGQSITVQGKTIQGTMQPKYSQVDLGNRVVLMDDKGNIVQSYAKGLTPSASSAAGGATGSLADVLNQAISSGKYSATGEQGKASREQLINDLSTYFAGSKTITPVDIANAVYGQFRGQGEGDFSGLTPAQVAQYTGKAATLTSAQQTLKDSITQALNALNTAVSNPGSSQGIAGLSALVPGIGQYLNKDGYAYEATKTDLATQLAKAITGSSRPSASVIQGYLKSLPSVTDKPDVAAQKLNNLRNQVITNANSFGFNDIYQNNPLSFTSAEEAMGSNLPPGTRVMINGRQAVITP